MKALKVLLLVAYVGGSPFSFYSNNRRPNYQRSYSGYNSQPYRSSYTQPFTAFRSTNYQPQPQRGYQQQYQHGQPTQNGYQSQSNYRYQQQQPQTPRFTPTQSFPGVRARTLSPGFRGGLNGQNGVYFGNDNRIVNIDFEVQKALNLPVTKDSRIKAPTDETSPNAAAALEYMKQISGKDGLCGIPTEVFLDVILKGGSREEANAEATRVYLEAYNRGERLPKGGPCEKADIAWRQAVVDGKDPVVESALVFMANWPGVAEGNPCAVSGVEYVKNILDGKTHLEANRLSVASFAQAFKNLARAGKPLKDKACLESTKAYWNAVPDNQKPDPANAKAFLAFSDKIFNGNAPAYDPVCLASLEGFFDSFLAGDDLLTANLKSARSFFVEFQKGKSSIPADSACAAATLAYAKEIQNKPSGPNAAGMIAYIAEAIRSGERRLDPVCGEATLAYWDAYIEQRSEAAANEAAAVAYLEALDRNPDFDQTSACARSAEAYIAEF